MTPRVRLKDARYQAVPGYPDLELDSESGIYYVRKFIKGKGTLFKSTREKSRARANNVAQDMLVEFRGRKPGMRAERLKVNEACDLLLADLEEQTRTLDDEGHPLRRLSTFNNNDKAFLRGDQASVARRRGMNERGVIRELFGDMFVDEIDEQFWKTWVKKTGRGLGRKLGDVAKYLSMVLTYAFEEKYLARKPRIKNPDKHKRKATVYTPEQVMLFFNRAEPTLQDIIVIGSENPIRPHENAEVSWGMVRLFKDKQGRPAVEYDLPPEFVKKNARKILLTPNAAAVVYRRHRARLKLPAEKRSPFVFPAPKNPEKPLSRKTVNRMWHRMKNAAGIPRKTVIQLHWFRHNVYRQLLKVHGVPIASVSQVGGTSIATLQKHYELEEEAAQIQVAAAIHQPFFGKDDEE